MFYTECPLKVVAANLCLTNKIIAPKIPWDSPKSECDSLSDSSQRSDDQDECGLVDALTTAITRIRISEPKRSRLCSPAITIQQECSSNLKNNLCTAFWPDRMYSTWSEWCPFFSLRRLFWFRCCRAEDNNSDFPLKQQAFGSVYFSVDEPHSCGCCKFCK